MNNPLTKLSRRERIGVLFAVAVLFAGGVLYPAGRAIKNTRRVKMEELNSARELNDSYREMLRSADRLQAENGELRAALNKTDGMLFDPVGNEVMMDAWVVKQLDQMAPDLGLNVNRSRASLHSQPGLLTYKLRGGGRYPQILNFIYQLETYRPLIVIQSMHIGVHGSKHAAAGLQMPPTAPVALASRRPVVPPEMVEPRFFMLMEIQLHCRPAEEAK